jgi:hypothetical protein
MRTAFPRPETWPRCRPIWIPAAPPPRKSSRSPLSRWAWLRTSAWCRILRACASQCRPSWPTCSGARPSPWDHPAFAPQRGHQHRGRGAGSRAALSHLRLRLRHRRDRRAGRHRLGGLDGPVRGCLPRSLAALQPRPARPCPTIRNPSGCACWPPKRWGGPAWTPGSTI